MTQMTLEEAMDAAAREEAPARDLSFAIARGHHAATANEMARDLKAYADGLPKRSFEELEEGQTVYMRAPYTGARDDVFTVLKTTPARKQLEAVRPGEDSHPFRAYKGSYPGTFIVLDEHMISMLGVTHRDVVVEALRRKLDVPGSVRVYYPELFITTPERFTAECVAEFVRPAWGKKVTDATARSCAEASLARIVELESLRSKAVVLNAAVAADYDRMIEGCRADIDFYRWIEPHLAEGGALHN